jgi:hypothetical protein
MTVEPGLSHQRSIINRVLKGVFVLRGVKQQEAGENCIMRTFTIFIPLIKYCQGDQIKEDEMFGA